MPRSFGQLSGSAYQLCIEMPILAHWLWGTSSVQIRNSTGAEHDAENGDGGYPNVQKAWRKVPTERAHRAPALNVTT